MTDKILIDRELLERVWECMIPALGTANGNRTLEELRAALADPAPAQEPIGWYWEYNGRPEGKVFFGKAPDQDVIERGLSAEFPCIVRYVYTSPQAQQLAEVIRSHEPIALAEVAALMGACAEKLARHHAPRLAA